MLISWHSDTSNSTRFLSLYNCFTEAEVTYELREAKKGSMLNNTPLYLHATVYFGFFSVWLVVFPSPGFRFRLSGFLLTSFNSLGGLRKLGVGLPDCLAFREVILF